MLTKSSQIAAGILALAISNSSFSAAKKDSTLKSYQPAKGIEGNLNSIGSDTLNNLMTFWAEGFKKSYPKVRVQVEGKGSSTAPPALINGLAQLAPMSRKMKNKEIDTFEKKFGFKPTKYAVAVDCLAVYVNKDNPIEGLTLPQVDAIFSKQRRGGLAKTIATWGDAGLTDTWGKLPISIYGRNSASGTYGYFKKHALFKGDFSDAVKEQPGSATVVSSVGANRAAIGYSGIGYRTSSVRAIPLSRKAGKPFVDATFANALTGQYPLGRSLYVYVVKEPNKPLPALTREFLRFVMSKEGQDIVAKDGYGRLPSSVVDRQLAILK